LPPYGIITPPTFAMMKAIGGLYRSMPDATAMTPARPPETVQNGSPRELMYAPSRPPARPMSMLNTKADRFVGVPKTVV
jgi:hypothetical protein